MYISTINIVKSGIGTGLRRTGFGIRFYTKIEVGEPESKFVIIS